MNAAVVERHKSPGLRIWPKLREAGPRQWQRGGIALLVVAVLGSASAAGPARLLYSYLLSVTFFISLSLGGLFFVLLQHLTGAAWSVVVRRLAEVAAVAIIPLGLLFAPLWATLLLGDARLYVWNDPLLRAGDELIRNKSAYLNAPFFVVRTIFYFAVWGIAARWYFQSSRAQDEQVRPDITRQMQRYSGPAMMAFALTICFASFDWLMSLDPHWFSTIYGVYFFAGCVVAFLAFLTLAALLLERIGPLRGKVTAEHFHDLGKLLFGFVFFWAYIAFSQYLLLWYANIPEETAWYLVRQQGGWQWISLLLLFGHFILPFCGLMSRRAKRSRSVLAAWCVWILLMHGVDLYWLIMPHYSPAELPFGLIEIATFLGMSVIYLGLLISIGRSVSIVPKGDPRLHRSLAFHNH